MLESKRLILRHLINSDYDILLSLLGDKDVMEFSDNGPLDPQKVKSWLENQIEGYKNDNGIDILVIENKSDSRLIGYCGLTMYTGIDVNVEIEIGYRLLHQFWGNGYATEAACVIRDYAFSKLNLNRLVAIIDPSNTGSVKVAVKLGMKYEKEVMMEGYTHADHLYSIHRK